MRKFLLSLVLLGSLLVLDTNLTSCSDSRQDRNGSNVECYRQRDPATNDWIYWYLLMNHNNGSKYYYHSTTPITSFSNVDWSPSNTGFNIQNAEIQGQQFIESTGFSQEMQQTFTESGGFESSNTDYTESSGFSSESSSSSGSESSGFDGGGGSDGGGGGESGGFE